MIRPEELGASLLIDGKLAINEVGVIEAVCFSLHRFDAINGM